MAPIRKGVTEFIRAGKSLFEMTNLSQEEDQAINRSFHRRTKSALYMGSRCVTCYRSAC